MTLMGNTLKCCGAASMDALDSTTTMLRVPCLQALLASTRGSLHAHQSDVSGDQIQISAGMFRRSNCNEGPVC